MTCRASSGVNLYSRLSTWSDRLVRPRCEIADLLLSTRMHNTKRSHPHAQQVSRCLEAAPRLVRRGSSQERCLRVTVWHRRVVKG